MKATEANLLSFIQSSRRFEIPIYQRAYSWTERECEQLWDDILRAGKEPGIPAHFVGSVVFVEEGLYQVSAQSPLLVIDGQQRLTTVMLLLEALARHLESTLGEAGDLTPQRIRERLLTEPLESGDAKYRMKLTESDNETFRAILDYREVVGEPSIRVEDNFEFFEEKLASFGDAKTVVAGLRKLMVVEVSLDRRQDNPQLIFESMNSTGKELSEADLVRNFILMGLEPELQARLYEQYWRPMEKVFGQKAYSERFDKFLRDYLTFRKREIPKKNAVYEEFKWFAQGKGVDGAGVEPLVAELKKFANYYCAFALGREADAQLAQAFRNVVGLKAEVAYPVLLECYADYEDGQLSKQDFLQVLELIESYIFRRQVCGIPTNSMNKTFASFGNTIDKSAYLESVMAQFALLGSYKRFPTDQEFNRQIKVKDLYNMRHKAYWLRRLENFGRKETVSTDDYTIEHIMPQNEKLSEAWQADLGEDWQRVQRENLHTLGNLTLTGYNSEYSDRPFAEKRDIEGGFKQSPLALNRGLGEVEVWNEQAIDRRAAQLAEKALQVWAYPELSDADLGKYRTEEAAAKSSYSYDDHKHLVEGGHPRSLFDAVRSMVLALDPRITEKISKRHITFTYDSSLVAVTPQKKGLKMGLFVDEADLEDPLDLVEDCSNVGSWTGEQCRLYMTTLEQLPEVMKLVTQAYEEQRGG